MASEPAKRPSSGIRDEPSEAENVCEVCQNEPGKGVACIPGIPMSVMYGQKCLDERADPFWALKSNVECCGGPSEVRPEYLDSRTYLNGRYMSLREALEISPD
jgi:hypothetical protein